MVDGFTDYDANENIIDQEFLKLINKLIILIALSCLEQYADEETEHFLVFFFLFLFLFVFLFLSRFFLWVRSYEYGC